MVSKTKQREIISNLIHYIVITIAIVGVFHLKGIHVLHTPIWHVGLIFATIAVVDTIWHMFMK